MSSARTVRDVMCRRWTGVEPASGLAITIVDGPNKLVQRAADRTRGQHVSRRMTQRVSGDGLDRSSRTKCSRPFMNSGSPRAPATSASARRSDRRGATRSWQSGEPIGLRVELAVGDALVTGNHRWCVRTRRA